MTQPSREAVSVTGIAPPQAHYSHGIVVDARRMLFVAGQVGLDEHGQIALGDAAGQTETALTNLKAIVEAAGADMSQVAKTTVYLTRLEDRAAVGAVRKTFFPDPPPANTLLVVASLAHPDYLVEIEAIVPIP